MGLSIQEKKRKIDFQDGNSGGHLVFPIRTILCCHLGFPIGTILTIFDLPVPLCFLPSFDSNGLLVQKKQKIDFQDSRHGGHLEFPIRTLFFLFLI